MKRLAASTTVVALMLTATSALGFEAEYISYRDDFTSVSYSGSDGSLHWKDPWYEVGENDGPAGGMVHVDVDEKCADYKCLHIQGEGVPESNLGAKRYADVSDFVSAEFCYEITRYFDEELIGQADADLLVQVSADGESWKTLESYSLEQSDQEPIHRMFDISEWLGDRVGVRFLVTGTHMGEVFIDKVEIKGEVEPTSTTTTTKPTTTTTSRATTTTTDRSATTVAVTTTLATTSTTEDGSDDRTLVVPPAELPPNSGLRSTDSGVQVNFQSGLFDGMDMEKPIVLISELSPNYKMAVELIESSWIWMIGLVLVIAAAILTGIDRRRLHRPPVGT